MSTDIDDTLLYLLVPEAGRMEPVWMLLVGLTSPCLPSHEFPLLDTGFSTSEAAHRDIQECGSLQNPFSGLFTCPFMILCTLGAQ